MSAAVEHARRLIRRGTPPALAIYKAAEEYGVDTTRVARGLAAGSRKHARKQRSTTPPANAWWMED